MTSASNSVVVITGASSGIGKALAFVYAERGDSLILAARRLEKMQEFAPELKNAEGVECVCCDVTNPEDLKKVFDRARDVFGRIDIVIANAGFGIMGPFGVITTADYQRQFDTNVMGVIETVSQALPDLQKSRGRIVLIGSVMSYLTTAGTSAYSMSKSAIRALANALYIEQKPHGVSVTLICPGFVDSEIRRVNNQGKFDAKLPEPAPKLLIIPADVAARKMVIAIDKRRAEYVLGAHGKIAVWIQRFFPSLTRIILSLGGQKMDVRMENSLN